MINMDKIGSSETEPHGASDDAHELLTKPKGAEPPTRLSYNEAKEIFVTSAAITIFLGMILGGLFLKSVLEFLGYPNNGDMGVPLFIYCVSLIIFAIFIVPKLTIMWVKGELL